MPKPLSLHAIGVLERLARRAAPRQEINPGVSDKLLTEGFASTIRRQSPYDIHKGKDIEFLAITAKGRTEIEKL
jgi:hypothetical protein